MNFKGKCLIFPGTVKNRLFMVPLLFLLYQSPSTAARYRGDLTEMSLEQLMKIEVVTVSKKGEQFFNAPAAVFTITRDDMKHAGIRQLPDAMRLAPGMQVGHVDANKWAISSRGFNMLFANKLLVVQDGRSLYSRIFSGVCWESQDVLLSDIDRIEIIRGPGATLWGANAVNGVINIITKSAAETQGGSFELGVGTEEKESLNFRYGSRFGDNACYRLYGKYVNFGPMEFENGAEADDGWRTFRLGFRMDISSTKQDQFMLTGEGSAVRAGQNLDPGYFDPALNIGRTGTIRVTGGHLSGRWEHVFSPESNCALQCFTDFYHREDPLLIGGEYRRIDLDFQHRLRAGKRHEMIWGMGYRFTTDHFNNTATVHYSPSRRNYDLYNAFAQDEIGLVPDRVHLTVGAKFEWTEYSGLDVQPNIRLRWSLSPRQTIWSSLARAVRTPSRSDQDVRLFRYVSTVEDVKTWIMLEGQRGLPVETLDAIEAGYRVSISDQFLVDMAAFYNQYHHLRTFALGEPFVETESSMRNVYFPFIAGSDLKGESAGFETALEIRPYPNSRMRLCYTYFHLNLHPGSGIDNLRANDAETESPKHQVTLLISANPINRISVGLTGRYVDRLEALDIDRYVTADFTLGYHVSRSIELNVSGRNLFDSPHMEFNEKMTPFEWLSVRRSFLFTTRVKF